MVTLPCIVYWSAGRSISLGDKREIIFFDDDISLVTNLNVIGWVIGGILVGIGTRMGNGCTSGHAVCGIPRLSMRSIVATCTFMSTAIALATFRYYVPFLTHGDDFGDTHAKVWKIISIIVYGCAGLLYVFILYKAIK